MKEGKEFVMEVLPQIVLQSDSNITKSLVLSSQVVHTQPPAPTEWQPSHTA